MRKFLPVILIVTILVGFLSPVGINLADNYKIKKNVVQADDGGIRVNITPIVTSSSIKYKLDLHFDATEPNVLGLLGTREGLRVTIKDNSGKEIDTKTINNRELNIPSKTSSLLNYEVVVAKNLSADTTYTVDLLVRQVTNLRTDGFAGIRFNESLTVWQTIPEEMGHTIFEIKDSRTIKTLEEGETELVLETSTIQNKQWSDLPTCTSDPSTWFNGCLIRFAYYAFFVPTSYLFAFAGTFFDFTFAYSVNDSSYRSAFVTQGWGIMRDFCNMFFIFVMLYISLSTILGLKKSKTQEMIINVIIVGLFINFSLFFTKIIIDSSNILARVFYTSDAIEITEKPGPDASNVVTTMGGYKKAGIIPMSAAIVDKIDPQSLVINANKINVPDTAGKADDGDMTGDGNSPGFGTWIIVIVLATAINIIGFTVFISVGLIFVLRIVGLWLAMIFSPLAFFSYTVPALGNIPKFGYKQWWPETLKMAFLAPIFMFFMYLILAFLDKGLNIMDAREEKNLMFVIAIMLPFAVIMVLMMEAKKIAVKFSGEMGTQVAKIGSSIGGLALGAASGGAALAMRGTVGRAATAITRSDWVQENKDKKSSASGWIARRAFNNSESISKRTFDARNTTLAKKAESVLDTKFTGNNRFTKVAEGGYAGALDRKIEKMPPTKLSEVDSYRADAAAKEWNRKYLDDMVKARGKAEAKGESFDEKEHKREYLRDYGPELLSADEQNKQNIKDRADTIQYGSDYVVKRNKDKEEKRQKGKEFNENDFRQTFNMTPRNLSETEAKHVRAFRSQIKPEKGPLNAVEREDVTKQQKKAEKDLDRANEEIKNLKTIATEIGLTGDDFDKLPADISDKIKSVVKEKQEKLLEINGEIKKIDGLMNAYSDIVAKNPGDTVAQTSLNDETKKFNAQQKLKQEAEVKIRELESFVNNKEKYETMKDKQEEIIKETKEKLDRK